MRHVAQAIHRLLNLAVYPARILERSPLPLGWLPRTNALRVRGFLYPNDDALLMKHAEAPLVARVFFGMANREGPRRGNLVTLDWPSLQLDFDDGQGFIELDKTKNGRNARWALDPGTAEALRRWKRLCPSARWVFPRLALPHKRVPRDPDRPMRADHLGDELRQWLKDCGVSREKLFENTKDRMHLRVHDLRATFVTLALANGKTEAWVTQRTGHTTSAMLNRYRRDAEAISELNLGWFAPLYEAIPELAALAPDSGVQTARKVAEEVESSAESSAPSFADDSIRCAKQKIPHHLA
jgi:integrase